MNMRPDERSVHRAFEEAKRKRIKALFDKLSREIDVKDTMGNIDRSNSLSVNKETSRKVLETE